MCYAEDFQERVEQFLDDVLMGVNIENYDVVQIRFLWAPRKFRIGGLAYSSISLNRYMKHFGSLELYQS